MVFRIPFELLPHVACFLPLSEKLNFAEALGPWSPDLYKVKEKRRLRVAVRALVLQGDVNEIWRLCSLTTPKSFRVIRPQFLSKAAELRDADMLRVLCTHFGGRFEMDKYWLADIVFPKGIRRLTPPPMDLREVPWQRFLMSIVPWDEVSSGWPWEKRFRAMQYFVRKGWEVVRIGRRRAQKLGICPEQLKVLNKWQEDYEDQTALKAGRRDPRPSYSGGLLSFVAHGAQDIYLTGAGQVSFF
jgi:hypothetical protein